MINADHFGKPVHIDGSDVAKIGEGSCLRPRQGTNHGLVGGYGTRDEAMVV